MEFAVEALTHTQHIGLRRHFVATYSRPVGCHWHIHHLYQKLVDNAPLWLDWQIEEIINNYDLTNSADFELANFAICL